jgi:DNA-binding CsgD family transcriptional regulator/pimeloyl-ACP methyl ester carboxylesterase
MTRTPPITYARSRDGVTLAVTTSGAGPALVEVPWVPFSNFSLGGDNPLLRAFHEELCRRLEVIQYDGRGTGHSQRDVTDLSLDAMVADLEAVVDLTRHAKVNLLGQYTAVPHVLAYAARHPGRVERIAVFAGAARGWRAMSAGETQALLSLMEKDWNLFAESAAHRWMGWSAGDAGRAVADALRDAVSPHTARATLQAASATDVTGEIPAVQSPALVLHRTGMSQIPVDVARQLANDLPRGRLALLPGSQPALFVDDPTAVGRMLADFFCDGTVPDETALGSAEPPGATGGLSRREVEVLRLVAAGESNGAIARRLGLSPHTVERHVANIYRKIDARGRADATAYALRRRLV